MIHASHHMRGIACALAGYTLWVIVDTLMKLAGESALPPYQVVGFLGLFFVIFLVAESAPRGELRALWPRNPRLQAMRAILPLGSNILNVIALKHLPLTLFYVTVFTAPMMIALLAALCLKERLSPLKVAAIMAGFIGVIIAIDPFGANAHGGDAIGYLAALGSTFCFAANTVWLRVMTQSETVRSLAFSISFIEAILGVALMLVLGHAPMTSLLLLILAAMALVNIVGNIMNFLALRLTTAANVAQFHYTQLVAGALIGYGIWHEIPTWHMAAGAILIIGSGLTIAQKAQSAPTNA